MKKTILLTVVFLQLHAAFSARDVLGELASLPDHLATGRTTKSVSPRQSHCSDQELFNQVYSVFCDPIHGPAYMSALTSQCEIYVAKSAQELVNWCSKNEDGTFCYEMREAIEDEFFSHITWLCPRYDNYNTTGGYDPGLYRGRYSSICTPECPTALSNFQQRFGCCANVLNVSSNISYNIQRERLYNYSFWSSCSEETPGFCGDSTLSFTSTPDQECSFSYFRLQNNLFSMFYCDPSHGNAIVNAYTACGQFETANYFVGLCGRNEDGNHCYEFMFPENGTNYSEHAIEVYVACNVSSRLPNDSCSSTCRKALENYKSNLGCCVNAYNNTVGHWPLDATTSYELWQACGVETPGFCPSTLSVTPTHTTTDSVTPSTQATTTHTTTDSVTPSIQTITTHTTTDSVTNTTADSGAPSTHTVVGCGLAITTALVLILVSTF